MVEFFELIINYPLQFLAGLGISAGSIYTGWAIIKGIYNLITKKSRKAKEALQQTNLVNALLNAIGGIEGFCDKVANVVIEKVTESEIFAKFKEQLQLLLTKDDCPIEIKAYIEAVLSQTGTEQIKLLYEQTKATLQATAMAETQKIINDGTEAIEQAQAEIEPKAEQIEVATTELAQSVENAISTAKSSKKVDDIEYA